jgi:hypothetical protein
MAWWQAFSVYELENTRAKFVTSPSEGLQMAFWQKLTNNAIDNTGKKAYFSPAGQREPITLFY